MQLFSKFLTQTDVERRLAVPTDALRNHFKLSRGKHYVDLKVKDSIGQLWSFRCCTRRTGKHPKPVFSTGWHDFVRSKSLQINDQVVFYKERDRAAGAEFRIEVKRHITRIMGRDIWVDVEQIQNYMP
ncbi:hypothetical protein SLA2020_182310 [Shorea laevis]